MSGYDLAALALAAWQAYKNNKGPQFRDPGLTPEQRQLYELYFHSLSNPALANNAANVSNYAKSILQSYGGLSWQSAPTHNGIYGYQGHPPANFDWGHLPTPPAGNGAPPPPPGPGGGGNSSPSPIPGDPFGHIGAQAGSPRDPFAGWPTPGSGSTPDGSGLTAFFDSHPNLFGRGPGLAATALASMFGLPGSIAAMLVRQYLNRRNQNEDPNTPNDFGGPQDTQPNPFDDPNAPGRWRPPQREVLNPPLTGPQLGGQQFINNQNYLLGNNGFGVPEFGGPGQPGFGYGMDYDSFYGGGGDSSANLGDSATALTPFRRGLVGQRV